MHLVFDTETTGFPDSKLSPTHPAQARICQLAAVLLDDRLEEVDAFCHYIKPDGWQISEGASKVTGITNELCEREGKPLEIVLAEYLLFLGHCDTLVCHNYKFDRKMLDIELANGAMVLTKTYKGICTMEILTPICKLPQLRKNAFGNKYKWPKLTEAYQYLFGEDFDGAHDALADVRATTRIYKELIKRGHIKIPTPSSANSQGPSTTASQILSPN